MTANPSADSTYDLDSTRSKFVHRCFRRKAEVIGAAPGDNSSICEFNDDGHGAVRKHARTVNTG